jgi:hypothetical protein
MIQRQREYNPTSCIICTDILNGSVPFPTSSGRTRILTPFSSIFTFQDKAGGKDGRLTNHSAHIFVYASERTMTYWRATLRWSHVRLCLQFSTL